MVVVWSRLSYTLPAITRLLLSTVDRVDVVVERISYAFCSSRSKPDLCESPSGLTTPPLPSSLPSPSSFFLSFWPLALTLHAVDSLPPAPLSPESLENPSDQRWVSQKLSDFGAVRSPLLASSSLPSSSDKPPSLTSHRAKPSSAGTTLFPLVR